MKLSEGPIAIGSLIVFTAWLFIGLPWLNSPSERVQYYENAQTSPNSASAQPQGTAQSPFFVQVIPGSKSAEERSQEAEDRQEKRDSDRWLVRWTAALFAATVGLILATGVMAYFAYRQMSDMKDSIRSARDSAKAAARSADIAERAMVLEDRPWIELDLEIIGPLKIGPDLIEIPIKGSFKNIGKSPAINVHFNFEIHPDIGEAVNSATDAAYKIKNMPIGILWTGQVLFPGKDGFIEKTVSFPRARLLGRIQEINKSATPDDPKIEAINPALCAFAYYGLPSSGRTGRFRYTTLLLEIYSALVAAGFDGREMIVVPDNLELIQTIFSGETT